MLALGALLSMSCKGSSESNKAAPEPTTLKVMPLSDASTAKPPPAPDLVTTASPPYIAGPSVITTESVDGAALPWLAPTLETWVGTEPWPWDPEPPADGRNR